jgi:hypothetical protein
MFKLPLVRGDPAEIVGNGGPDAQDEPGKWPDRRRRDCRSATKPAAGRPPRLAASRSSCKRRVLAAGPVSKRAAANAEVLIDLERCAGMDDDQQSHRCQEIAAEPDDPEVCGPAPEQRYRLHRKRATMSMPWLLVSATAVGQIGSRDPIVGTWLLRRRSSRPLRAGISAETIARAVPDGRSGLGRKEQPLATW